ncbi:hypothetical protein BBAL3_1271 [Brevundimonas sp. BAL3]|uniref:hypothetical protein n=1 Tax=Brevundimonas sp. BAL3 TaxID=391600 RepID=UPI00017ED88D|nr:hypothetical protein [Brevundimonas sp. BAL3]EDX80114.1 hypothetical protein BBAL3_1271 [Brevundimonas sp. BAL3]
MKLFSAEALAALASGDVIVSGAVRIGSSDPIRLWGGHGALVVDGEAYEGVGSRGLVSVSSGSIGGAESPAALTLDGVESALLPEADLRSLRGAPVVIRRLVFDGSGAQLLHAAVYLRGRVDTIQISETPGGTASLTLSVEGAARGLGRRSERMRTDADQRMINPTDGGMSRVSYAGERSIYWGGKPPARAGAVFGVTAQQAALINLVTPGSIRL